MALKRRFFLGSAWVVCGLLVALASAGAARADEVSVEEGSLTGEERALLQKIKRACPDLLLSERARRYYTVHPDTKAKLAVAVELVFEAKDGMIDGQYIAYSVVIDPVAFVVSFTYDAGTALRGSGSVLIHEDKVVKTESSCGTSGCTLTVQEDGKTVYQAPR